MPRKTKSSPRTRQNKKRNNKRKKKTRKVYRKRVKFSQCRKKRASSCRQSNNCKMAMGTKRRYCRKKKNAKVRVLPKSK